MRLCFRYALYCYMSKYSKKRKNEKKIIKLIREIENWKLKEKKRERDLQLAYFSSDRSFEHRFNVRDAIEDENVVEKDCDFHWYAQKSRQEALSWRARATGSYSRDARLQPEHMEHREDLNSLVKVLTEVENANSW